MLNSLYVLEQAELQTGVLGGFLRSNKASARGLSSDGVGDLPQRADGLSKLFGHYKGVMGRAISRLDNGKPVNDSSGNNGIELLTTFALVLPSIKDASMTNNVRTIENDYPNASLGKNIIEAVNSNSVVRYEPIDMKKLSDAIEVAKEFDR